MFHKLGVTELTIIDLTECPLAPADGELEHFSSITMSYIQPSNNILLNMLSAGSDLSTSQSARMCRQVDGSGERLRNRTDSETLDEARGLEAGLFESHHVHSRMNRLNVGITAHVQGLMRVLATKCNFIILCKVNEKLNVLVSADSSTESVTIIIKELDGVEGMQKRMYKLKRNVELLKKWNATLVGGTREDPPLNP
ncbi:hypothetical protein KSP40_PGU010641 [Platanthera guangdongensis]|uniref:Uncharacterized protein n=1 Tax=Platanthera guangdongensis TaxID=2320717 RepID=A0ABR2N541_9ASPA